MGGNRLIVHLDHRRPDLVPCIDPTRRLVEEDEVDRYYWEVHWADGRKRVQYEFTGDGMIFQTLFGKLADVSGIREIRVYDLFRSQADFVFRVTVPEGFVADILLNRSMNMSTGRTKTIQSYGYRRAGSDVGFYVHFDPDTEPPSIMKSKRRTL